MRSDTLSRPKWKLFKTNAHDAFTFRHQTYLTPVARPKPFNYTAGNIFFRCQDGNCLFIIKRKR